MPTGCFIFLDKKKFMKIEKPSFVHIFQTYGNIFSMSGCYRNKNMIKMAMPSHLINSNSYYIFSNRYNRK